MKRRKSLRELYAASNAADRYYAAMNGAAPQAQIAIREKRVVTNRSDEWELEASVISEVGQLLAVHPAVLCAWRQNSGSVSDGERPVWFWKWVRKPRQMTLTDFLAFSTSGFVALECKRRSWKFTGTEREIAQASFIDFVKAQGGRGGFVTCADEARKIIEG